MERRRGRVGVGITTSASALQVCYSDDYRFELPTRNNVRYKKCIRSV